jgi:tRNA dimethylallyltransferase
MGASVWLIAGPTASGKSALALALAEALGGEIVNADSMQLYADIPVLSAAPDLDARARAPHHLYGVADAAEAWSVGRWLAAAAEALDAIAGLGRPAIVVGGTGLDFRALTQGLADIPPVSERIRERVQALWDTAGEAGVRERLTAADPAAEARIAPGDRQRLVRALAVAEATGVALSEWQARTPARVTVADARAVVLEPPREALYARCDARLAAMLEAGALKEAARLRARRLDPVRPAMKALGVREFIAHLDGVLSLADALTAAQQETRRYAKRQTTWFRHQAADWPRIGELDPQAQWQALQGRL